MDQVSLINSNRKSFHDRVLVENLDRPRPKSSLGLWKLDVVYFEVFGSFRLDFQSIELYILEDDPRYTSLFI